MSDFVWAAAIVVVLLALALVMIRGGMFAGRRMPVADAGGRNVFPSPQVRLANGAGDPVYVRLHRDDLELIRRDIDGLHVFRHDLKVIGERLETLIHLATEGQQTRVNAPPPLSEPARADFREPVADTAPEAPRMAGAAWRQEPRDPASRVWHDEHDWGFDANPRPASPAAQPRAPSPDAVYVEANQDVVVTSARHPPEAWLERSGGEGDVWLSPSVMLSDAALQRWSTFFDWERRTPGACYEAIRPARVTWSGGAGSVVRKGMARPA